MATKYNCLGGGLAGVWGKGGVKFTPRPTAPYGRATLGVRLQALRRAGYTPIATYVTGAYYFNSPFVW